MSYYTALVVEDEPTLRQAVVDTLELSSYKSLAVSNAEEALNLIKKHKFGIAILDVNLGSGMNGTELLAQIKLIEPSLPVLITTAYASIENAVSVMQTGAVDYLVKPFIPERLISLVQRYSRNEMTSTLEPIAISDNIKTILQLAKRVARTLVTVLIMGESGTGKEVIAKYIHGHSSFSEGPFIAVNCAAIPENMLEAMLFGYEKGAFTGAYNASAGKFELAQNGTLLLDEISEMPLALQAKLLRVIQEKKVERLGGKKTIDLNIRIISASNKNLKMEVKAGEFREDLYYRLSVFPLLVPALRERQEDIIPIAQYIISEQCKELKRAVQPKLSEESQSYLISRKWLGNIRELENVLQRALILQADNVIEKSALILGTFEDEVHTKAANFTQIGKLNQTVKNEEYKIIIEVLTKNKGCRKATAENLGISARTLRHKLSKMRSLGMEVPLSVKKARGDT